MSSIMSNTKPAISLARSAAPTGRVLPDLSKPDPRDELIAALMDKLAAAEAAKAAPRAITLKISEKGALCVYGLGRFPVTLYAGQWRRLLEQAPAISAFLKANAATLTEKPTHD
jgi:hypothetical protein